MKALSISGLDFSLLSHCKSFCDTPSRNHVSIWNLSTWVYSSKVIRLLVSSLTVSAFSFWELLLNHPSPLIMKEHRRGTGLTSGQLQSYRGQVRPMALQTLIPKGYFLKTNSTNIILDRSWVASSLIFWTDFWDLNVKQVKFLTCIGICQWIQLSRWLFQTKIFCQGHNLKTITNMFQGCPMVLKQWLWMYFRGVMNPLKLYSKYWLHTIFIRNSKCSLA